MTRQLQELVGDDLVIVARRCRPVPGTLSGAAASDAPGQLVSRSEQHRQGRVALGAVLAALGDPRDPRTIRFPQPRLSVSHSAALAVAIGSRRDDITGTGVDVEFRRPFPPAAARFFLDPRELRELEEAHDLQGRLLELWTAKEAVYKADPDNRTTMLRDYRLERHRPGDPPGQGSATRGEHRFSYRVHRLGELVLAVAHRGAPPPAPLDPTHPTRPRKGLR